MPPEAPTATTEPQHDIYAGFTDNKALPYALIHKSGERLVVTQDINSAQVTGVVWTSVDGESIVIYADNDGRPQSAVIGGEVVLYSNYTNDTVDITVIHADGTRETFQSQLDVQLLNKITAFAPSSNMLIAYSTSKLNGPDVLFYMKFGLYLVGAGMCISAATTAIGVPMAAACSGFLLASVIRMADIYHLDVTPLKNISNGLTLVKCALVQGDNYLACINTILTEAEVIAQKATELIANLPRLTPEVTKHPAPPGIYPIGKEYSQSGEGWRTVLDYIEVLNDGTVKVSNVWTNTHTECAYQGDCQVYCSAENDDAGALMIFVDGTHLAPIATNCTQARGQVWSVLPGETFNDWAIYPPLEDGTESFSMVWYALGSVNDIVLVTSP